MPTIPERYGVPKLTLDEAARLLKVPRGELIYWLADVVIPSPSRWSDLKSGTRVLPEWIIRYYLMKHPDRLRKSQGPPRAADETGAPEKTDPAPKQRRGKQTATG